MTTVLAESLRPLTYNTLSQECYTVLKRGILNLELAPGATLDEVKIAQQLQVSKTPVREAVARLEGEGLVTSEPGRKSRVAEISLKSIHEIFEVRQLLESASIRELAPKLTDEDLEMIRNTLEDATASLQRDEMLGYIDANEQFHAYLIRRTGNQHLINIANGLFDQARRVSAAVFRSEQMAANHERSRRGMENHFRIHDALCDRDGERAAQLIRKDIQSFLDAVSSPEMQERIEKLSCRE